MELNLNTKKLTTVRCQLKVLSQEHLLKVFCGSIFLGNNVGNEKIPLHSGKFMIDTNQFELGIKSSLCYVETENYRGDIL